MQPPKLTRMNCGQLNKNSMTRVFRESDTKCSRAQTGICLTGDAQAANNARELVSDSLCKASRFPNLFSEVLR